MIKKMKTWTQFSLHANELSSLCLFEAVRRRLKQLGRFDYLFDLLFGRQTNCRYLNRSHSSLTSSLVFSFLFWFFDHLPNFLDNALVHSSSTYPTNRQQSNKLFILLEIFLDEVQLNSLYLNIICTLLDFRIFVINFYYPLSPGYIRMTTTCIWIKLHRTLVLVPKFFYGIGRSIIGKLQHRVRIWILSNLFGTT